MRARPLAVVLMLASLGGCRRRERIDIGKIEVAHRLQIDVLPSSYPVEVVRSLTGEVGPRLGGSPAAAAAVRWGVRALDDAGLENARAEPVSGVPHWERGVEVARIVGDAPRELAIAALGGSVATDDGGVEAEVVEVSSLAALEKLDRAAVAGKIVFVDVHMRRTKDGSGYGEAAPARSQAASKAGALGAVAVVLRSIGTAHDAHPHTGGMRYADGVPRIPAAALSDLSADVLHERVAAGGPVRLQLVLGCRTLPDAEGANVVGEIAGKELGGEIVLLGAHLDSWDLGRGAVDDGAGVAIVLGAARAIARMPTKPKRTIRVVLFANEENGLAGAKAYAKLHAAELDSHVFALEADLGSGAPFEVAFLGAPERSRVYAEIAQTVEPIGIALSQSEVHGGADLIPLRPLGIPFGELRQDATRYFDVHHAATDTVDQIDPDDLNKNAAALASIAYGVAEYAGSWGKVPPELRKER